VNEQTAEDNDQIETEDLITSNTSENDEVLPHVGENETEGFPADETEGEP
jgi:hypothetical protein